MEDWEKHEREEWRRWDEQDVMMATAQAHDGDSEAQNKLGYYYTVGKADLEVDLKQAAYWYGKAAEQAPSNAQQSCVDEKNQHGVAHNEGYQDEKGATALAGAARPVHEKAKEKYAELKKNPKNWDSRLIMSGGIEK